MGRRGEGAAWVALSGIEMELLVPTAMTTAAALWEPQARDWVTVTSVRSGECQCEYECEWW